MENLIGNRLLAAKVLLVILIGLAIGYVMHVQFTAEVARVQGLTYEEYAADYDKLKLEMGDTPPLIAEMAAAIIVLGGFIGLYELAAWLLAKGFDRIAGRGRADGFSAGAGSGRPNQRV